ncbi:hypothetical protein C5167_027172 [Papaver somniferum]|nr:hypothetical protein C5167_027172 [Papaver somniferum]
MRNDALLHGPFICYYLSGGGTEYVQNFSTGKEYLLKSGVIAIEYPHLSLVPCSRDISLDLFAHFQSPFLLQIANTKIRTSNHAYGHWVSVPNPAHEKDANG